MTKVSSRHLPSTTTRENGPTVVAHLPGLYLLLGVAILTMRRFVFTAEIPAGTDMFGFISRSSQYSSFGRLYDAWSAGSFGSRRVFNFDNILGALTLLTRNPVSTVKFLDVLTLFGAGLAAYILAWSWYKRRLAASIAGLFYMSSQTSLTQWGSGHLNVEIIIALAPLMLFTWSLCLEQFKLPRAVGFTFAVGVDFLIRADLALYVAPFLLLYSLTVIIRQRGFLTAVANAVRTLAVAVPGILLLNCAWLIPFLNGYRVAYETLNQLFNTGSLSARSVDFYSSLLGFGREIGYFNFTGVETWYSYPWMPIWAYYAFATIIPVLAYSTLWWRRDRLTVFLALAAVLATLAAPGTRPPLGVLYLWSARYIPVFGNLRDPTRWLVIQALAYALLAGLAIDRVVTWAASRLMPYLSRWRWYLGWNRSALVRGVLALCLAAAGLTPVLPTFVIGLRTWHVTSDQRVLLNQIRNAPGQGMAASIPFDQDYQYLVQGSYQGYEHDLGYESVMFTGRQDVDDGGWDQRSANFASYEANLLDRDDPAFSSLLSSAGVRYLISLSYPLVAPQLISQTVGAYTQQANAAKMGNLAPLFSNPAGTDYTIKNAASPLSFRRNIAIVLGGSEGAAALADQPGIDLSDWAVITADDIIQTRGYAALLTLMRQANIVLLADERPLDIAVEGASALGQFSGITSDPQLDRAEINEPSDQSAETGSLNDGAIPIPQPNSTSISSTVTVSSPRSIQIWGSVLAEPQAATIQTRVDGKLVSSFTPVTLGAGGFEWSPMGTVKVGAGKHKITISAEPSTFGDRYEIDETRVLDLGALDEAENQLNEALASEAGRVAYSFDLNDVSKWNWESVPKLIEEDDKYLAFPQQTWTPLAGSDTAVTSTTAPSGVRVPRFSARAQRPLYTVVNLKYPVPLNWSGRPYVYLEFDGTDSGNAYQLAFDFGLGADNEARYTFTDDFKGWQTLAFSTTDPGQDSGTTDWSRVESVRIALPSKSETGAFAASVPLPSKVVNSLTIPLPVMSGTRNFGTTVSKPSCIDGVHIGAPGWLATSQALVLPVSSMTSSCRLFAGPPSSYRQLPAMAVSFHQSGTERLSYSFSASQPGVLVWTQAYDALWKLSGRNGESESIPILSLLNGYLLGPGDHSGTIAFAGESPAVAGVIITVVSGISLLLLAIFIRRRGRHIRLTPYYEYSASGSSPPVLRHVSEFCLIGGIVLLVLCPIASLTGRAGMLVPLGFAAIVALAAAVVVTGLAGRFAPHRDDPNTKENGTTSDDL